VFACNFPFEHSKNVDYRGPFITVQGHENGEKTLAVLVNLFGMQSGAFGDGLWPRY